MIRLRVPKSLLDVTVYVEHDTVVRVEYDGRVLTPETAHRYLRPVTVEQVDDVGSRTQGQQPTQWHS